MDLYLTIDSQNLILKIIIKMIQKQQKNANSTNNCQHLVEEIVKKQLLDQVPNEVELCKIVKKVRFQGEQPDIPMVSQVIRKDIETKSCQLFTKKEAAAPLLITHTKRPEIIQPKSNSLFKQFSQSIQNNPLEPPGKQYICRSKRKVRPQNLMNFSSEASLEEMGKAIDIKMNDCRIIFQPKNKKNSQTSSNSYVNQNCLWAFHEHFYSQHDKIFFREEIGMKKLLEELGIQSDKNTFQQSKAFKKMLPKPKLFSSEFIYNQQVKLYNFRTQIRSYPKTKSKSSQLQFSLNREVLALHPICGHIHSGTIFGMYKQNQYIIKFHHPELGSQKVLDLNIHLKEQNSPNKPITENLDFQLMALTFKLLQYKYQLIAQFKKYNDFAEKFQDEVNNKFLQYYGWLGCTINVVSMGLRHIMSKFRTRGLNNIINQEAVGKSFQNILLNPLVLMGRQLEKSTESSDLCASKQIKKIVNNHRQLKVEDVTSNLLQINEEILSKIEWQNETTQTEIQLMLKTIISILANLKISSRYMNLYENRHINSLIDQTSKTYPEKMNQIYELLHSVTSKLN